MSTIVQDEALSMFHMLRPPPHTHTQAETTQTPGYVQGQLNPSVGLITVNFKDRNQPK